MFIHEAALSTTPERPFITRRAWMIGEADKIIIKIQLTDTPDGCVLHSSYSSRSPCRGWQPRAIDLKADDWFVCSPIHPQTATHPKKGLWKRFP